MSKKLPVTLRDFHCTMNEAYQKMVAEIAQSLYTSHGRDGEATQYDSLAARHCVTTTHKVMFPEKY